MEASHNPSNVPQQTGTKKNWNKVKRSEANSRIREGEGPDDRNKQKNCANIDVKFARGPMTNESKVETQKTR